jgi:omega-6 fatty acid desaturase (delta-12 desaturase)
VAIPVEPAPVESVEYRKQLAERYGFEQIGEPLPDNVTLKDVITSLPKKVVFLKIYVMFCSVGILSLNFSM